MSKKIDKAEEVPVQETETIPKKKTATKVRVMYTPLARNHKAGSFEFLDRKTADARIQAGVAIEV